MEYLSCVHCECNYSCVEKIKGVISPTFCQIFSFSVDPEEKERNKKRAQKCDKFVPRGLNRRWIITPEYDCWYEKDSMG